LSIACYFDYYFDRVIVKGGLKFYLQNTQEIAYLEKICAGKNNCQGDNAMLRLDNMVENILHKQRPSPAFMEVQTFGQTSVQLGMGGVPAYRRPPGLRPDLTLPQYL
jgi:hypothetical protein